MGSFHVHLGVTDVVDECPIFSNLLRGHLFLFPGARLIVVQQCDEALVGGAAQRLIFHPREEWIFSLIITPVGLGACTQIKNLLVLPTQFSAGEHQIVYVRFIYLLAD